MAEPGISFAEFMTRSDFCYIRPALAGLQQCGFALCFRSLWRLRAYSL
jgi:hypothetical protein